MTAAISAKSINRINSRAVRVLSARYGVCGEKGKKNMEKRMLRLWQRENSGKQCVPLCLIRIVIYIRNTIPEIKAKLWYKETISSGIMQPPFFFLLFFFQLFHIFPIAILWTWGLHNTLVRKKHVLIHLFSQIVQSRSKITRYGGIPRECKSTLSLSLRVSIVCIAFFSLYFSSFLLSLRFQKRNSSLVFDIVGALY